MRISDWSSDVCSSDLPISPCKPSGHCGKNGEIQGKQDYSAVAEPVRHGVLKGKGVGDQVEPSREMAHAEPPSTDQGTVSAICPFDNEAEQREADKSKRTTLEGGNTFRGQKDKEKGGDVGLA